MPRKKENVTESENIVRITFQHEGYTGNISFKIKGRNGTEEVLKHGLSLWEKHNQADIDEYEENDCDFRTNWKYFFATLKNKSGDKMLVGGVPNRLKQMLVSVKIVK